MQKMMQEKEELQLQRQHDQIFVQEFNVSLV